MIYPSFPLQLCSGKWLSKVIFILRSEVRKYIKQVKEVEQKIDGLTRRTPTSGISL